ncbi:TraR/DksA family transcriptional regulator [Massilia eurypsychrophila]|uniref:TraR/DksA family transcriptional regulator n=1 Tax=Massilia eurypsychrophila TaxID=1485217 RepID=UPI0010350239|nr:TraR/DksA family transcriptional regulator [Massilia eurypsychrophila]
MRQLTSSDLDELESRLRSERHMALEAIRDRLVGYDSDEQSVLVNFFAEHGSKAADGQLGATDIVRLRAELARLDTIDMAMKRLDFGAGGICVVCGNPIPLARLRAAPASLTCLHCQRSIDAGRETATGAPHVPGRAHGAH